MNFSILDDYPELKAFVINIPEKEYMLELSSYNHFMDFKLSTQQISINEILAFYQYCQSDDFIKMHSSKNWTNEEWKVLIYIVLQQCRNTEISSEFFFTFDWQSLAKLIIFKDTLNCQYKWYTHLRYFVSSKNWKNDEDKLLLELKSESEKIKWLDIQYLMFIKSNGLYFRKAKQYRERWYNHLDPQVKRGIWTEDDDYNLLSAALIEGTKWSNISKRMKDRTENQVKNRFKALILKEKKITQVPEDIKNTQNYQNSKLDSETRFLIQSQMQRLKPNVKLYQNFAETLIPLQIQQKQPQQLNLIENLQPQQYFQPFSISPTQLIQQQLYQQQQYLYYQQQFYPQLFGQQHIPQYQFNLYSSQQNSPVNSIDSKSSFQSEQLIEDNIKEDKSASSSSNKEPIVQKQICGSAKSIGSTNSVNSYESLKQNLDKMQINSEACSPVLKKKHSRSQSGVLFDVKNQGKIKTKRSKFYYASNEDQ